MVKKALEGTGDIVEAVKETWWSSELFTLLITTIKQELQHAGLSHKQLLLPISRHQSNHTSLHKSRVIIELGRYILNL